MTFPYTNRLARGICEFPLTVPKRNSLFLFSSVIVVTIETVNGSLGSLKQWFQLNLLINYDFFT